MPSLKLKIPPPVVAFLIAACMWLLARATPSLAFHFPPRRLCSSCVLLAGVGTALAAMLSFRRARTTINPLRPENASSLVNTGIFRLTRNPMYLGLLLALTSLAIFLTHPLPFLLLPGFVLYMNRFQIIPEETALSSAFGQPFADYRSKVRRWL